MDRNWQELACALRMGNVAEAEIVLDRLALGYVSRQEMVARGRSAARAIAERKAAA